ncbi:MAG: phosphatase PAP2 family protein [Deltaproteobacteria bacterium]|nr:phosphatase PAP2 family protein [Deltaproteobacteria bacterium]
MQSLRRPYRVSLPMVVLVGMVPVYVFIPGFATGRAVYVPEVAWDRLLPLQPVWGLIYGALYLFLILLPVFTVRAPEHLRRTVLAYLLVWTTAYVFFFFYPTAAPRPETLSGEGFAVWSLRFLYDADPPYNCFPSLHVAHSCVGALAAYRVHRTVGIIALVCAALVGLSTLFIKQHYILDVVAGALLALLAYALLLRTAPRDEIPELDRRLAPVFALGILGIASLGTAGAWIAYQLKDAVR